MNRAFGVTEYTAPTRASRVRRSRRKPRRLGALKWLVAALVLATALTLGLMQPFTAVGSPDHSAGDYVAFAKAVHGTTAETACNGPGNNAKQVDISGSNHEPTALAPLRGFWGLIHSNADFIVSGSENLFQNTSLTNPEVTFGTHPGTCDGDDGDPSNVFAGGGPTDINTLAPGVDPTSGWPGTLGSLLEQSGTNAFLRFDAAVVGSLCEVGTLADTNDLTIDTSFTGPHFDKVVCNGTGKTTLNISSVGTPAVPFKVTMISRGLIDISGENVNIVPAANGHGFLAATDVASGNSSESPKDDKGITLAGSNFDVPRNAIFFTPRTGQSVSGSNDSTLCIQLIGQGSIIVGGSSSGLGPKIPGCGVPATVVTDIHADLSPGGSAHTSLGQSGAVEVGTEVHDQVTVSSNNGTPLTGTMDFRRFKTGTCEPPLDEEQLNVDVPSDPLTHTFEDVLPFTSATPGVFSYRAEYNGDTANLAAESPCEGPIRFVDARITITPGTGDNAVGDDHELTGHVDIHTGEGVFVPAPAGTTINFAVETGSGDLSAPSCTTVGTTGSCSVDLTNTAAGTDTVSASTTVVVEGVSLSRSTNGNAGPGGSGNATKNWVDARISIDPLTGTNEVGDDHPLEGFVEVNPGSGFVPAAAGTTITFAMVSGTGTLVPTSCTTVGATGKCSVDLTNTSAGTDVVSASTTVLVGTVSVSRTTNGNAGPGGSGNATKSWVDARIKLSPLTAGNEVGANHTVTVTVEVNDGTGFAPATAGDVSWTLTDSNGASSVLDSALSTCDDGDAPPPPDNLDASGQCLIVFTSATAGTTSVDATVTVTVGGIPITRQTGTPANEAAGGTGDAGKTWVKVRISIAPLTDANEAGTDHLLTITLEQSVVENTWTPLAGELVTASITNTNGATAAFVPPGANTCTTGAGGTCNVTINSPTAGTTTVEATWAGGTVQGAAVTAKTTDPDAEKTWVKVRITITPATDANEAGTDHELTITLERSVVENTWMPLAGEEVSATITNSSGATAVFVPAGDNTCTTGGSGTCTVTINSPTAGTTTVEATWAGGTVAGATIGSKTTDPDAQKTWVKVRITITPATDANEAGTNHELTITLEQSVVENTWTPVAGQLVSASIANTNGATAAFVPPGANTCTTSATGICTVTINSPTAGTTTVEATWAGGTVAGATIGSKTTDPDAQKTWVKVRISITPLNATNPVNSNHLLTVKLEQSVAEGTWTALAGETISATLANSGGATATFVGGNTCVTNVSGECTLTISSPTAGTTTVEATWAGGTVAGATITAKVTEPDASKSWVAAGGTLLIIDEDSLDNGIHFNDSGGIITPSGPDFFGTRDVNDDRPGTRQRAVLATSRTTSATRSRSRPARPATRAGSRRPASRRSGSRARATRASRPWASGRPRSATTSAATARAPSRRRAASTRSRPSCRCGRSGSMRSSAGRSAPSSTTATSASTTTAGRSRSRTPTSRARRWASSRSR